MKHIDVKQLTSHAQSAWDSWYRFSDRACHYTAQTWEWYCSSFFSTEAMERYETIGDAIGLMMICAVSLGMAARVTWEDWRRTDEAQQLAEFAVETLEDAKPHVERLAYQAVNLIARPVLNRLGQGGPVLNGTQAEAMDMQGFEGGPVLNGAESLVIDVDIAMTSLTEHLQEKEIPELLLIADQLSVAVPTVQCSKGDLITLMGELQRSCHKVQLAQKYCYIRLPGLNISS